MSPARHMSAALKAELVPALAAIGFEGTFPHFIRSSGTDVQVMSVLYHPSGGQFILEFGALPAGSEPEAMAPADRIAHVSLFSRARLETQSRRWFNFARYGSDREAYQSLSRSVSALLPQVDTWLSTGEFGANVHAVAL
jgi:hypothetical protein